MGNVIPLPQRQPQPEPATKPEEPKPRRTFGHVTQQRSGRFQASYVVDGQRYLAPVTFATRGDAGSWLDMRHAEILEYRWKPAAPPEPDKTTFATYATAWLEGRELKPRTHAEYTKTMKKLRDAFGEAELRAITPDDVRAWYATLDPTLKTARAHAYALFRTVMASATSDGLIASNPVYIRGASTTRRARKIRPATLDQLATIAEHMPERYRVMVLLASWTALRFGELTELRRRDVLLDDEDDDEPGGVIHVSRAVTWPNGKPVVGTPKSEAGIRDVYVPPHIVPALRDHLDKHAQPGREGLLFPNTEGGHLHHGSLYKVFKPARAAAGRPDLTWHGLRHTGATMAAQQGATLAELMERLGHSTVTAALRYQHAASDRQSELARRLSKMAAGRPRE